MYEKLDKLRAEVERCKKRIEDDRAKLKIAEARLQEAENSQILEDVGALNLSPEQLAEFLKLVSTGKVGNASALMNVPVKEAEEPIEDEYDESEETEDDEN